MKKIIFFFLVTFALSSCQKDPNMSDLDADFVVITDHDKDANFNSYSTYFVPDSVLIIDKNATPRYWKSDEAVDIIPAVVKNMNNRGYTQVNDKANADLGIQISFVTDVSYFYNYNNNNGNWWWGYPGYWSPGYWGNWGGWYYPYPVTYSYKVGSLLVEMVDLQSNTPVASESLPVVWTAYMTGLLSGSDKINTILSVRAIDQAFAQSTYIKK